MYRYKYLKYKNKYLQLMNQKGGNTKCNSPIQQNDTNYLLNCTFSQPIDKSIIQKNDNNIKCDCTSLDNINWNCNCNKKYEQDYNEFIKTELTVNEYPVLDNKNINNETIGISFEKAWCLESEIECKHNENRINYDYVNKFRPIINKFLIENPKFKAIEHIGGDNKDIDFIIQDNKNLSLKTLKRLDGKICPQNIGQPTYISFDKIWNLEYQGKYEKNKLRLDFIKKNIKKFLNDMLKNLFCCDYEIIGYNCEKNITIEVLKKPTNMNYFNDFDISQITFTKPNYEEKWNEKKQKNSEYSTTIKIGELSIGELQFHKTSRKVIKFRFFRKFLKTI